MKKIFLLALFLCQINFTYTQTGCHDVIDPVVLNQQMTLRLVVHVVKDSNGENGLTQADVDLAVQEIKDGFSPYGIFFNVVCNEIESDECFFNKNLCFSNPDYFSSNCLNIFLRKPDPITSERGEGYPGLTSCVVYYRPDIRSSETIHELGHTLNLLHTWSFVDGVEKVTRTSIPSCPCNCLTTGDLLCDTPANPNREGVIHLNCKNNQDPMFDFANNFPADACDYDYHDTYIYPDFSLERNVNARNYMSYYNNSVSTLGGIEDCADSFSKAQVMRMKNYILNDFSVALASNTVVFDTDAEINVATNWIGQTKNFDRDVIVAAPLQITNSTILFTPSHRLIIRNGGEVNSDNSTYDTYMNGGICLIGSQWTGFRLEAGAKLELENNSKITNALIAIEDVTALGSSVNLLAEDSEFINNEITLKSSNQGLYAALIDCNIYVDNNHLSEPLNQIELKNSGVVIIIGTTIENETTQPHSTAVNAYNSLIFFRNAWPGYSSNNSKNLIKGWRLGLNYANRSQSLVPFQVEHTIFEQCKRPITINNLHHGIVRNCDIDLIKDNPGVTTPYKNFSISYSGALSIENNVITALNDEEYYGIDLNHNAESGGNIKNNLFENDFNAAINSNGDHGSMFQGLNMDCNDTGDIFQSTGGEPKHAIKINGEVSPKLGTESKSAANLFSHNHNVGATDLNYSGLNGNVPQPMIYFFSSLIPAEEPHISSIQPIEVTSVSNIFDCGLIGSNLTGGNNPSSLTILELSELFDSIANEINVVNSYIETQGNSSFIMDLIIDSSATNPTLVLTEISIVSPYLSVEAAQLLLENSAFYLESEIVNVFEDNSDLLRDEEIGAKVFCGNNFSQANRVLLKSKYFTGTARTILHDQLIELHLSKNEVINLVFEKSISDEIDNDILREWMKKRKELIFDLFASENLFASEDYNAYDNYMIVLKSQYSKDTLEILELENLNILLKTVTLDNRTEGELDSTEINTILGIANGNKGFASNKAQGILNHFYDYEFTPSEYSPDCPQLQFSVSLSRSDKKVFSTIFYPNPSKGIFNIDSDVLSEIESIEIYNQRGELVLVKLNNDQLNKAIDLSNFKDGIYFYRITLMNSELINGKLIKS